MEKVSDMTQGIIGQPLTSVNFTMDYLSLDFNQTRLTYGLMPVIVTGLDELESTSDKYADKLRSLIGIHVTESGLSEANEYLLRFQTNTELRLKLIEVNHELLSISSPNQFELIK